MGDPSGQFTEALDLSFDSAAIFGNNRSKRYALLVEAGKVKEAFVEPDNIGLNGRIDSLRRRSLSLTTIQFRPPRRSSPRGLITGKVAAHKTIWNNLSQCIDVMLDNDVEAEHRQLISWRKYEWYTLHVHMYQ